MMKFPIVVALAFFFAVRLLAHSVSEEMVESANRWLAALDDGQRQKAVFAWNVDERAHWNFVPMERLGLTVKEMNPAQRYLAFALLHSGLSYHGYSKVTTIMSLEQILAELEGPSRRFPRDPELYHFSIFGTPDTHGTWGWRVEGHHVSLNFTIQNGKIVSGTPSFLGTNPGQVRQGPRKGLRVLGTEEDLGRSLVKRLTSEQQKVAIFDVKAPEEVVTGSSRKASIAQPVGLLLSKMNRHQRELALQIIHEYIDRVRPEVAERDWKRIEKAGLRNIRFAWAGGLELGQKHYYRMHGPTFLLEYDNTQNDANHVHAVWRDFENDFGFDALSEHYAHGHSHHHP